MNVSVLTKLKRNDQVVFHGIRWHVLSTLTDTCAQLTIGLTQSRRLTDEICSRIRELNPDRAFTTSGDPVVGTQYILDLGESRILDGWEFNTFGNFVKLDYLTLQIRESQFESFIKENPWLERYSFRAVEEAA